ncbi:MAG: hypothetical protein HPAVJP_3140 [Candidatus Hepatoplasma vulgare]|nr:MAG: hypothetical protein HPAVJP_3140 [Candidatus Hepatoplasma sp.]
MNFLNKITENSKLFLNSILKNTDGVNRELVAFVVKHKIVKVYWGISKENDKIWLKSSDAEIIVNLTEEDLNFLVKYLTYSFHNEKYDIDKTLEDKIKSLNFPKKEVNDLEE